MVKNTTIFIFYFIKNKNIYKNKKDVENDCMAQVCDYYYWFNCNVGNKTSVGWWEVKRKERAELLYDDSPQSGTSVLNISTAILLEKILDLQC